MSLSSLLKDISNKLDLIHKELRILNNSNKNIINYNLENIENTKSLNILSTVEIEQKLELPKRNLETNYVNDIVYLLN